MTNDSRSDTRPFKWATGLPGTIVLETLSAVSLLLSVVCGMIAIALFSVLFTGYVAWIPFVPDAWHASVAFVVAVLIAVPFIFVADTVLSFVLIVAAVLLIEGCLFLWRRAKSLFSRRKT